MENNESYKIVIKSINQLFPEETIQCKKSWTFKQLKNYVSTKNSDKSFVENRLIYSQRLIRDDELLRNVFSQYLDETPVVLYVVPPPPKSNPETPSTLCKRNVNEVSTTATTQFSTTTAFNPSTLGFINPYMFYLSNFNIQYTTPSQHIYQPQHPYFFQNPEAQALFGALLSTDTEANGVYSMDQVTWMQQMYYQYFMQFYQNVRDAHDQFFNPALAHTAASTPPPSPLQAPQQPDNNQPPPRAGMGAAGAAAAAAPAAAAAAGGGAFLMEEEEDGRRRDWLDWSYATLRFFMLMSILFFYTTPARFFAFLFFFLALFIFQVGWLQKVFMVRFFGPRQQQQQRGQPQQPEQQQQPDQPQLDQQERLAENPQSEQLQEPQQQQQQQNPQQHRSAFSIIFSFIVGFFTSLAPQIPPPINN